MVAQGPQARTASCDIHRPMDNALTQYVAQRKPLAQRPLAQSANLTKRVFQSGKNNGVSRYRRTQRKNEPSQCFCIKIKSLLYR